MSTYKLLPGIVGGLGPKASSVFIDKYIVDGRVALFTAMSDCSNHFERCQRTRSVSSCLWTEEEVERVWKQTLPKMKLTDQDHIPLLLFQSSEVAERSQFLMNVSVADPALGLKQSCDALAAAGATSISLVCNTAHCFANRIFHESEESSKESEVKQERKTGLYLRDVPFLDMLALTFDVVFRYLTTSTSKSALNAAQVKRVGVLATEGCLKTNIHQTYIKKYYTAAFQIKLVTLLDFDSISKFGNYQGSFNKLVFGEAGIKAGFTNVQGCEKSKANLHLLFRLFEILSLLECEVIILGCTELSLIFDDTEVKVDGKTLKVINPAKVLADELLKRTLLSRGM